MGEKVKRGIKGEDGSYTYYYDKSPYPGNQSKRGLINANKETKSGMQKKMSGVGAAIGNIKKTSSSEGPSDPSPIFNIKGKEYKVINRKSGSSKTEKKKMPKARDMAMGNKNIVYLGDPYMVDGEMFDPVKAHPEDYLRPEGADNYSTGGEINVGKGGDYIKDLID